VQWFSGVLAVFLLISPSLTARTILVLPFFNLTKSKNLDWVGESVAEALRESLTAGGLLAVDRETRDEGLRRLSVRRYAVLAKGSVIEIATNLDADTVLYGEFNVSQAETAAPTKAQLRISARIVNLKQVSRGPEFQEAGPLDDLSSLQNHMAWQALQALSSEAIPESAYRALHPPIRVDALESYIRGLLAPAYDQKYKLFASAALLEPTFSEPCFQLGKLQFDRKNYRPASEWLEKVQPVNSRYREALFLLGLSRFQTGNFAGARDAFTKVAKDVPLAEVLNDLGAAQLRLGDTAATDTFRRALESDQADPVYHFNLGYALWQASDFEKAAALFRTTLDRSPDDQTATLMLGRCLKKAGPRSGDLRTEGLERLKFNYDESAWRHLKAVLDPKNSK
jgi:Flp pilus assembly protein TadD/TolB-like protein